MTPAEFRAIRKTLGLSQTKMGEALGYAGKPGNRKTQIHRMEVGKRPIRPMTAKLATSLLRYNELSGELPDDAPTFKV